ncbi:transposase [Candidatus Aerophobetes bacterium]|nr:transposase [Candidatus Aerophobetes bacterium]
MTRPLRIEFPGAVYHITSRGNARESIFLDDNDRDAFLEVLCFVVRRCEWILHAYCLMGNHYHVLIETPQGNLSQGMRQLNGIYTQRFNRRHNRVGHVFQGRYKAILVDKENYLLELCRYVVLNPVRADIVKSPEHWQWSSYRGMAEYSKGISCLTTDWMLSQFGEERKSAILAYREFVHASLKEELPLKKLKGQIFLGEEGFMDKVKQLMRGKDELKEIPKIQRYITRPSLDEIFKGKATDGMSKDKAMYEAHVLYGYTLKDIAEFLGVHYATVSRAVKRGERKEEK